MAGAFRVFGAHHLAALAVATVLAAAAVLAGRRWREREAARTAARILAVAILAAELIDPVLSLQRGLLGWQRSLPVDLCDLAAFATALALWTGGVGAFGFAWFWGLSGTLQALLTPTLVDSFPHPEYFRFFLLHAGIVVGVLYLGPGLGLRPRKGAVWRVYGWTAAYAAAVGLLDWALDANYFFLCRKPEGTLLDAFGPWPWYIAAGAVIGALLFWLLDLPFRRARVSP